MREDEHDLGEGHSFVWMSDGVKVIGLIESHPHPVDEAHPFGFCGGWIRWARSSKQDSSMAEPRHQLVTGSPGDEDNVTISPSLACIRCPSHGYIRAGKWVDA
jgi:hypothetical protein